jgi:phosphate:Na+ symporter
MTTDATLEFGPIFVGLAGGLSLFLFGMEQMTAALKNVAGGGLKTALARLTRNRFTGLAAGTLITAVLQSSSVTTVLLVGFVSAGLISFQQSIGVILGADIGTTITAQIVAFDVTRWALLIVALGFAASVLSRGEKARKYGSMVLGLGLVFFGMELMSEATGPLRGHPAFVGVMAEMETPLLGIMAGAVFTAVVQSSSATMGVVIVLAGQGFLTLSAGIALVFGANIGTCVTALLAAIGKSRDAVRVAVAHVLFKVVGVAIWFAFIPRLAEAVRRISPTSPELGGVARLAAETPRQIANAHTLFNVANALLFLPLVGLSVWVVQRLVPDRPRVVPEAAQPRYLDELLLDTPVLALDRVRMELRRLGEQALTMVRAALTATLDGTASDLQALRRLDEEVDLLHVAIVEYLAKVAQESLDESRVAQHQAYLAAANRIESIGDLVETNLVAAGLARLRTGVQVSQQTRALLTALHARVCWSVEMALQALDAVDPSIADLVTNAKQEIKALTHEAQAHLATRLIAPMPNRLELYSLESEIIEYLERVYLLAKGIAKLVQRGAQEPREAHEEMDEVTRAS